MLKTECLLILIVKLNIIRIKTFIISFNLAATSMCIYLVKLLGELEHSISYQPLGEEKAGSDK